SPTPEAWSHDGASRPLRTAHLSRATGSSRAKYGPWSGDRPIAMLARARAVSSVGRAPARQAGGHWFEPSTAHPQAPAERRRPATTARPCTEHLADRLARSRLAGVYGHQPGQLIGVCRVARHSRHLLPEAEVHLVSGLLAKVEDGYDDRRLRPLSLQPHPPQLAPDAREGRRRFREPSHQAEEAGELPPANVLSRLHARRLRKLGQG